MTVSFDSDGLCFSVSKLTHFLYCFPDLFSHLHADLTSLWMPSRIFQQHLHVLKFEAHIKGFLPLFQNSPIHVFNSLSHPSTVNTAKRNNGSLVTSSYEKSELQDYGGVNLWGLSHPAVVTFRSNSKTRWSLCFIPQHGGKERIKFILYHLFIKCFEVHCLWNEEYCTILSV